MNFLKNLISLNKRYKRVYPAPKEDPPLSDIEIKNATILQLLLQYSKEVKSQRQIDKFVDSGIVLLKHKTLHFFCLRIS